jgi:hypothetical protein
MADGSTLDPAAWTRASFKSAADFTVALDDADREELRAAVVAMERGERPGRIELHTRDDFPFRRLGPKLQRAYGEVRAGRGFIVLRGIPTGGFTLDRFVEAVWGLGTHLGRALSQDCQGELIGHLWDASHEDPAARTYRSAQALVPRTDITAILTLACWHKPAAGGVYVLTSGVTVHNQIKQQAPALLAPLYRGFHCHRLGEEPPGEPPITPHRVPVFAMVDEDISCHYQRSAIAAGERGLDHTLSEADLAALDLLDEVARMPENRIAFRLERGDMLVINNYAILHARTRFTNHTDAALKRHVLRLWLDAPSFRKVPFTFNHFAGNGVPAHAGKPAPYDFKKLYREAPHLSGGVGELKLADSEII